MPLRIRGPAGRPFRSAAQPMQQPMPMRAPEMAPMRPPAGGVYGRPGSRPMPGGKPMMSGGLAALMGQMRPNMPMTPGGYGMFAGGGPRPAGGMGGGGGFYGQMGGASGLSPGRQQAGAWQQQNPEAFRRLQAEGRRRLLGGRQPVL